MAMNGIHLTAKEQQLLEQTLHTTHDARLYRRTLALLECSRGRQVKDVAQALGVTRQSVHNWAVRFQQQHSALALTDGPRPGRPRHADDRVETLLRALLAISPERCGYQAKYWTAPLLCDQVRKNLHVECCDFTLRLCLKRMGYRWKRPRYVLAPDPQREKKNPDSTDSAALTEAQRHSGRR
jgi:transposase